MGKRGPKPQPTALKKARGNPGKRPLNDAEPEPDVAIPEPPEFLSDYAREEWDYIAPKLEEMNLIARPDRAALAAYCQAYGRKRRAEEHINEEGEIVERTIGANKKTGDPIVVMGKNPWYTVAKEATKELGDFIKRFGLSPSDRSGVREIKPGSRKPKSAEKPTGKAAVLDAMDSGGKIIPIGGKKTGT